MKILIALDDSAHSERALALVTRMRWPAGSRVLAVSVMTPLMGAAAAYEAVTVLSELLERQRRQAEAVLARAGRALREAGFPTETRVIEGDAREALIDVAVRERVDLVVVGSHGRTGFARWMLGSVSSHVVTHAPCSVLVVKPSAGR